MISASTLYNYLQCTHRVWRDKYGPQEEKNPEPNPFVQLLWDKGVLHEGKVVSTLGQLANLSEGSYEQRFEETIEEMKKGTGLIYQGVLMHENLLGIPDLLKSNEDGTYTPIDIKSGRGFEGSDEEGEEKYKKHYAVQLCHYVEILKKLGFANSDKARIIDIHNQEVIYDLQNEIGIKNKNTWWQFYYEIRNEVELMLDNKIQNKPAMAGICKLCPWYKSCKTWAKNTHDLTTIFYLGRSKRDKLNEDLGIERVEDIINVNVAEVMAKKATDKNFLSGIAEKTLTKIVQRAFLLNSNSKPVIYKHLEFPQKSYELYFDIEDDPTQEMVYLHGVYERSPNGERFVPFVASDTTPEAEKQAWIEFWEYIRSLPTDDFAVYYYSQHEKTIYKKMRELYPNVVTEEELEAFFDKEIAVDLYTHVILPHTDWPLGSYSVKEIAQYLGFKWRDETPSGALSIQWYNEYLKDQDPKKLQRILDYNEDDCKATMVIKDYLAAQQMK
ncbi:MAG: TM0106 family RecB-like putative nuclease [Patescibacteria group bacterium]|mgnify:CR=1 FL=1